MAAAGRCNALCCAAGRLESADDVCFVTVVSTLLLTLADFALTEVAAAAAVDFTVVSVAALLSTGFGAGVDAAADAGTGVAAGVAAGLGLAV